MEINFYNMSLKTKFIFYIFKNQYLIDMKKHLTLLVPLVTACLMSAAQPQSIASATISQEQIDRIQNQLYYLKKDLTLRDSSDFIRTKVLILTAIEKSPRLEFNFEKTTQRISDIGLFSKLTKANNPTEDILGASYVDVVSKAVETHLLTTLGGDSRKRFSEIVSKIVNNPIVTAVMASNPVTQIVSSITNAASGFFESTRVGIKLNEIAVKTQNVIHQDKLDAFNKELLPYINFYDNMVKTTDRYLYSVEQLQNKHSFLSQNVSGYNERLLGALGLTSSGVPLSMQVEPLFSVNTDADGFKTYQLTTKNTKITNAIPIADEYKIIETQVRDFQSDYNEILPTYLYETATYLQNAKTITLSRKLDAVKIDGLINDIIKFSSSIEADKPGRGPASIIVEDQPSAYPALKTVVTVDNRTIDQKLKDLKAARINAFQ